MCEKISSISAQAWIEFDGEFVCHTIACPVKEFGSVLNLQNCDLTAPDYIGER